MPSAEDTDNNSGAPDSQHSNSGTHTTDTDVITSNDDSAASTSTQSKVNADSNGTVTHNPQSTTADSSADTKEEQDESKTQQQQDETKDDESKPDETKEPTDIVIVGGETPAKLTPWSASSTGLRCAHPNEESQPQHEACLFEAAYTDNVELAQRMIDIKVNVNCRRYKNRTPLHYCAIGNGTRVAQVN